MKKMVPVILVTAAIAWLALPLAAEAGCGACGGGEGHTHEKVEKSDSKTCAASKECKACPEKKTCDLKDKCAVKADCKACEKAKDGELCKSCVKACVDQKAKCSSSKDCPKKKAAKKACCGTCSKK